MKITFKAKVVANISNAPKLDEPTMEWLAKLIKRDDVTYEFVWFSFDNEPTLIIEGKSKVSDASFEEFNGFKRSQSVAIEGDK